GQIPHISGDGTAWTYDALHFCDPLEWVGDEADRKRHGRGVERAVRIRHRLRVADVKLRQLDASPSAGGTEHTVGRIDSTHRRRGAARDRSRWEGAVAAGDVEPAQALRNSEPI